MKTILIILMIILALVELWMYFRLHGREQRLEQRIKYVESREESAREVMKRNGLISARLTDKERALDRRSKVVEERNTAAMMKWADNSELIRNIRDEIRGFKKATQVIVGYVVTDADRQRYSDDKIPAVAKSRIANKLGHMILGMCPDALVRKPYRGHEDAFVVEVFVKSKLENLK
ncbi:MAG: hypothetical protein IJP49_06315 [Bacteroidales bacterium]|nr:hypothetical protein [Bacteroidales bacterium]